MKCLTSSLFVAVAVLISGCELSEENNSPVAEVGNESDLMPGVVTYVVDGDTFDVELDSGETERIRPILVDAPEICHQSSPADCEPEPYGEEASIFAEELLLDQTVYLEQDVSETDRYDRVLAYVYLENGDMFQELLLAEGLAEVAVFPPDVKYQAELEEVEQKAKENGVGIWSD